MTAALFDLSGKVALVTGGSGGLGRMIATTLAAAGADVAVAARSVERCEPVADEVRALGRRAAAIPIDVVDPARIDTAIEALERKLGPIDILFNNAGVTSPKPLLELTVEDYDRIVETSLKGAFLCTQAVAPGMIARRSGRIVNMSSIISERGIGRRAAYCAAKGGLTNLTRACAIELGPHGITVNAIAPTVIVTDLNRDLVRTQPALYRGIIDRTPLGRLGETSDLAGAVVFLSAPASAFVTGHILYVDGGYTAG